MPYLHASREERFDDDVDILEAADVPLYSSDDEADAGALSNLPVVVPGPRLDPVPPPAGMIEAPNGASNGCEAPRLSDHLCSTCQTCSSRSEYHHPAATLRIGRLKCLIQG